MAVPSQPLIVELSSPASIPLLTNLSGEVQRAPLAITKPPATPKNYYCQELSITQKQALNDLYASLIKITLVNSLASVLWPIKLTDVGVYLMLCCVFNIPGSFHPYLLFSCSFHLPFRWSFSKLQERRYQDYHHRLAPITAPCLLVPQPKIPDYKIRCPQGILKK